MFSATYTKEAQLWRPQKGTLGVTGESARAKLIHEDDETPVIIRCKLEERGRVTIDARQRQVRTDATLLYSPEGKARIEDGDIVVCEGAAYEVVGTETMRGPWGGATYSRVDLVKSALPVEGGGA
jgi:hypothetical protein